MDDGSFFFVTCNVSDNKVKQHFESNEWGEKTSQSNSIPSKNLFDRQRQIKPLLKKKAKRTHHLHICI